ncbi:RNA polymerase, sigma-24 subunit, ECF subfamily [Paenibacillus sp. JDR-2]|nr:RNA polymerase, sigma-24 subunit, ECF subfamily [Paenibacillus sp. JDR-2]
MKEFKDLERAYRATHKRLRAALVKTGENGSHPDENIIRGAISDVNFAIGWMQTGKRPGSKRGIERRGIYANTKLVDPLTLQSYANPINSRSGSSLTEDEKELLREALDLLSDQERECYVMSHGHGLTHAYIAEVMKLSKSAVASYIKRAHEKVSKDWQRTLF